MGTTLLELSIYGIAMKALMKQVVKSLIPKVVLKVSLRTSLRINHLLDDKRNAGKTVREVFTQIYNERKWIGGSGSGSEEKAVTQPYVNKIMEFLKTYRQNKPRLVDLGCGNLKVGENFINYSSEYICIDIVPALIEKLKSAEYPNHVKFLCLDVVEDDLPNGDMAFLRQVLQHLSNEQIVRILPKLKKYKVVFITEHYPTDNPKIVPNKNMIHGSKIRVLNNSGVYLDKPPFNVPTKALQLILEVPGIGLGIACDDQGVIRTYKLEFKAMPFYTHSNSHA